MARNSKKPIEWINIKILHSSLMGSALYLSSCHYETGDIVRVIYVSQEKIDKYNATPDGKENPDREGPRYITIDREVVMKGFATTDISPKEYQQAIKKLFKQVDEQVEKKKVIDRRLKELNADIVIFSKAKKEVKILKSK